MLSLEEDIRLRRKYWRFVLLKWFLFLLAIFFLALFAMGVSMASGALFGVCCVALRSIFHIKSCPRCGYGHATIFRRNRTELIPPGSCCPNCGFHFTGPLRVKK